MPSCATLASRAFKRSFTDVRSCRCPTQHTPAGEIDEPRHLSASEMRTWPQAGCCSIASATTACSIFRRHSVLQHWFASANLLQQHLATFVAQLLEPVKATLSSCRLG